MKKTVANRLREKCDTIVRVWEQEVRAQIPSARIHSKRAIKNSIPSLLESLTDSLTPGHPRAIDQGLEKGRDHGEQRAHLGNYSLAEVISEYSILRQTIFGILESESVLSSNERDIVLDAIFQGIREASSVFSQIQLDRLEEQARLLRQTASELARSNQELAHFAHVASHDLKEPLRTINTFLTLLQRRNEGILDADSNQYIDFATMGAQRMYRLIEDLLEKSQQNSGTSNYELIAAEVSFQNALLNLAIAIQESGAHVSSDALPNVHADPVQLTQVFQNLISNSIKYRRLESPNIHVSGTARKSDWLFSVRDNGLGIPKKDVERIFQAFERVKQEQKYPGVGIGLATCKRIIERHGGQIWVDSEPGLGSIFSFTLPHKN